MKPKLYKRHKLISKGFIKVDDTHEIYYEERGNKEGIPIINLHGGPGGGFSKRSMYFYDPKVFREIYFDQRGVGKSKPFLELKDNDIFHLAEDIETIRKHFNLGKVYLSGGSFGTTLALTYAIKYPNNVKGMLLRGIFLGRQQDVNWLYQDGAVKYYPEQHKKFKDLIEKDKQHDLVSAYYDIFMGNDEKLKEKAYLTWANYELSLVKVVFNPKILATETTDMEKQIALMECVYFKNHTFFGDDNYILDNTDKIKDIPTWIVHGRYDMDCTPEQAYLLDQKLNNSKLYFVDLAGHSSSDTNMSIQIIKCLDEIIKKEQN